MLVPLLAAFALQPSPELLRQVFEDALAQRKSQYGESDARTAQASRDLGIFLARQGDFSARSVLAQTVGMDRKIFGAEAPRTIADIAELAAVSDAAQAEPLWLQVSKSSDPSIAARAFAALGNLRERTGDRQNAALFHRKALAKEEIASGKESPRVAAKLNALALLVSPAEGIALLDRALRISTVRLGSRRVETASIQLNLAGILLNAGRPARAAQLAKSASSIFEQTLGPEHPRSLTSFLLEAHALRASGDRKAAGTAYRRLLSIEQRTLGPQNPQTLETARILEDFLREATAKP